MKYLGYIQFIVLVLFIWLGWQIIDRITFREEMITPLGAALQSAKNNRKELEKVLRHYQKNPADSLKYKAACFLIENMPFYSYSTSKQLENYKSYYAWLKKSRGQTAKQVADSVKKVYGPLGEPEKKHDIREVDSAYLCNNIEWAFKVWREQPWGKNVSFETFCEYILPYRIEDETLEYWREMYYEKYNSLLDSLRMSDVLDKEDPIVAAKYLRDRLLDKEHYFTSTSPALMGHIGPRYVQYISGSCREATDFGIYLFRSLGIPCGVDFVPMRSGVNAGHFWLVAWDKNQEAFAADFPKAFERQCENMWYKEENTAKVYRNTFCVNRKMYEEMRKYEEELYPFWRLPKFVDVTREYAYYYKKELKIPPSKIYREKCNGKIAYLCASKRDKWVPVAWTEYDVNNITFRNIKKGMIMRIATYEEEVLHLVTDPFYVDPHTNELHFYSKHEEIQDVVLYSKYNIVKGEIHLRRRMLGGVFEGSNQPDFSEKDTLFMVQKVPGRLKAVVRSWSDKKYRYFRYFGAKNTYCNVAEVEFYECNDTSALKGSIIGTPLEDTDKGLNYYNVFDGKTKISFNYSRPSGGWSGLDMGRKVRVDRIVYTPRNRDNYIRPGDTFELLYCDKEWKSMGKKQALSDSLVYSGVPKNTLLLLRNHTRGVEERIFVYENGRQICK